MQLAKQWLTNTREIMQRIEDTQMDNIRKAAEVMADSIEAGKRLPGLTINCRQALGDGSHVFLEAVNRRPNCYR